jgi:hypothetical protein
VAHLMGGGRGRRGRPGGVPPSPAGAGAGAAAAGAAWDPPWPRLARSSPCAPWSSSACTARSCRCGRAGAALDAAGEQRRRRLPRIEAELAWDGGWAAAAENGSTLSEVARVRFGLGTWR